MLVVSRPGGTFGDSGDMSLLIFGRYMNLIPTRGGGVGVGVDYGQHNWMTPLDLKMVHRVASQLSKAYESHHHTYTKSFHTVSPPEFLYQLS